MAKKGQRCVAFQTVKVKGHTGKRCKKFTRGRKPWPWGEGKSG